MLISTPTVLFLFFTRGLQRRRILTDGFRLQKDNISQKWYIWRPGDKKLKRNRHRPGEGTLPPREAAAIDASPPLGSSSWSVFVSTYTIVAVAWWRCCCGVVGWVVGEVAAGSVVDRWRWGRCRPALAGRCRGSRPRLRRSAGVVRKGSGTRQAGSGGANEAGAGGGRGAGGRRGRQRPSVQL